MPKGGDHVVTKNRRLSILFFQMATAEFYQSFNEIRCFRSDTRLEYTPPLKCIKRSYFYHNEGKTVSVAISCVQCGCLLATRRDRKILALPTTDWESIHFGCAETKVISDKNIKRVRRANYNMLLFCSLWLEIRDDLCDTESDEDEESCACFDRAFNKSNFLFLFFKF